MGDDDGSRLVRSCTSPEAAISSAGGSRLHSARADREQCSAPRLVDYLGHGQVDRGEAAEQAFPARQLSDNRIAGDVPKGEQSEKNGEREEDRLNRAGFAEGADPHEQVGRHSRLTRRRGSRPADAEPQQEDQREPEEAVGREGGGAKVALLEFHDAGDDLRDASVKNPHCQYHGRNLVDGRRGRSFLYFLPVTAPQGRSGRLARRLYPKTSQQRLRAKETGM